VKLPLVHRLPNDFNIEGAFLRLVGRGGCLWFDSAAPGPMTSRPIAAERALIGTPAEAGVRPETRVEPIGRYSFLTADPVAKLRAFIGCEDPWPELRRWASLLPPEKSADLPPFQGGIAGLWGYEAAAWLEDVGVAVVDDLPTPAVSVGVYDWVICHDSVSATSCLISQGFYGEQFTRDPSRAQSRLDQVLDWLAQSPADRPLVVSDNSASDADRAVPTLPVACSFETDRVGVTSNFSSTGFRAAIDEIIRRIHCGDSFQVNLAQRLTAAASVDPATLYLRLRQANPAPLAGFYDGGDFQVLSSSPEGFLHVRDSVVETRPIKGTVARTGDATVDRAATESLKASEKDHAENVMIVDLMRNDLSRVCEDDSVVVTQLCEVEHYAFVQHLVSVVRGRLRPGISAIDLLAACFPGGSVTGAPKIEAMRTIAQLEPTRRGPYCGSLGYVSVGGDAEFNILIRTLTAAGNRWQIPVGGGITAQSRSVDEERETWVKAEGMLRAMPGGIMPT
jgi:para-aminobenzoate synthetase component 1